MPINWILGHKPQHKVPKLKLITVSFQEICGLVVIV